MKGWAPGNLLKGMFHQPSRWVGRALRALVLDRSAYTEVAEDSYMTGPALLITIVGFALATIFSPQGWSVAGLPGPARRLAHRPADTGDCGSSAGRQGGVYPDTACGRLRFDGSLPAPTGGFPGASAAGNLAHRRRDVLCHLDRRGRSPKAARLARNCTPGRGDDRGHHRCVAIPALFAGAAITLQAFGAELGLAP